MLNALRKQAKSGKWSVKMDNACNEIGKMFQPKEDDIKIALVTNANKNALSAEGQKAIIYIFNQIEKTFTNQRKKIYSN